jgi:hypothetical protein
VVGEPAVRERDVGVAFEDDDLRRLVLAAEVGTGRGARGDASDDHGRHRGGTLVAVSSNHVYRGRRWVASPLTGEFKPVPSCIPAFPTVSEVWLRLLEADRGIS